MGDSDTETDSSDEENECNCNCVINYEPPDVIVNYTPPEVVVNYTPPAIEIDPPIVNVAAPNVTVNTSCEGFICKDRLPVLVCRIRETGPIESTRGMTFRARSKKEWEWGFSLNDGSRWGIQATLVYDATIEPIRN